MDEKLTKKEVKVNEKAIQEIRERAKKERIN